MSILIILGAALLGCIAGFFTARRFAHRREAWVIASHAVLAATAAAGTNAVLFFLNLGLAFEVVDALEAASYFVFGFSFTAAWMLLGRSHIRWLLLVLLPIALYEPLRWVVAFAWLALKRM